MITNFNVERMGMFVDEWIHESCTAIIGTQDDWATIYSIQSRDESKGHASFLLVEMKKYYEASGKDFGSSVALNNRMRKLLQKFKIKEYSE